MDGLAIRRGAWTRFVPLPGQGAVLSRALSFILRDGLNIAVAK
jgi:hypothetical protein